MNTLPFTYFSVYIIAFSLLPNSTGSQESPPKLLIVSFDGFRWDYLNIAHRYGFETPNFDALIENGSTVADGGVINAFPTKTLPNHYTIATGMYPGHHGVVHNNYHDPKFGDFNTGDVNKTEQALDIVWWNNGTTVESPPTDKIPMPVWIANQLYSVKNPNDPIERRSGVMFPGNAASLYDQRAFHWISAMSDISNTTRIDKVVSWFVDKKEPINFGALYFNEPDWHGHAWGPESRELMAVIADLDSFVGYLIDKLKEKNIYNETNLIIISDHGMAEIRYRIKLNHYIDMSTVDVYGSSPVLLVWPHKGYEDIIYANISKAPNMTVYRKDEIPKRYFYQYNRRISPLLFVADPSVTFCKSEECSPIKGNHGYDNLHPDMHPLFIAHGPAFRVGHVMPQFNSVDIYPLMCHVLGVEAGPHHGNFTNVRNVLRVMPVKDNTYLIYLVCFAVGLPILVVVLYFSIKACHSQARYYHRINRDYTMKMSGVQESLLSSEDEI